MEDKLITDAKICRTLGLNLQNNLAWEVHLTTGKRAILPAARKQLGMISKLKDSLSFKTRLLLVNSLVLSKLMECHCGGMQQPII